MAIFIVSLKKSGQETFNETTQPFVNKMVVLWLTFLRNLHDHGHYHHHHLLLLLPSPDVILCGWLDSKHRQTNFLLLLLLCLVTIHSVLLRNIAFSFTEVEKSGEAWVRNRPFCDDDVVVEDDNIMKMTTTIRGGLKWRGRTGLRRRRRQRGIWWNGGSKRGGGRGMIGGGLRRGRRGEGKVDQNTTTTTQRNIMKWRK